LLCLSHVRWDLVFQRPQHLMTRFARCMPVYFVEEPSFQRDEEPSLIRYEVAENLTVLVPHITAGMSYGDAVRNEKKLLHEFCREAGLTAPMLWFYTPEALRYADDLESAVTVYDCMDELSAFQGASPELNRLEAQLLKRADVVFTGGVSLYEAKRKHHSNVHGFPSAVDAPHFMRARLSQSDPPDQAHIPHPRLGFFGVIDERLDRDLIAEIARLRPDWQLILVGPVVKIDPRTLPRASNIHFLGRKTYEELPAYIASWDVAVMPFSLNEATRFISPTKTPEYLASGKPVVSTPIVDVVGSWGHLEAVRIAGTAVEFVTETASALELPGRDPNWLMPVDAELDRVSWDRTWKEMAGLTASALRHKRMLTLANSRFCVPANDQLGLPVNGAAGV
jgi:UDP-galactopyranose mutase